MTKENPVKKRILLVEDEKDMAYAVSLQLEAAGYEVVIAADGQDALRKAEGTKPDLIILDLMLPKVDGYKVCRMLKFDTRYAKIPVIIFSARTQDLDKKVAKEVGADAYITKPFAADVLLGKIREFIGE